MKWTGNGKHSVRFSRLAYLSLSLFSAGYERMNVELRLKIATLEVVTANLKNGLIHSFQRKEGLNAK